MDASARSFLEDMIRKRGYALDFHRVLAEWDPEFLMAYEQMQEASYLRQRRLPRLTKELIFIGVLAAMGAGREQMRAHMIAAANEGATAGDVLEALELTLPPAGVTRFIDAVEVWKDVFAQ